MPVFSTLSSRFLISITLLGLLLRLLFIPFSMHVDPRFTGDLAAFPEAVQWWNSGQGSRSFPYPPLAYYTFSMYLLSVVRPFTADLLNRPISGPEARSAWLSSPDVFRNLFILKVWYLLPDVGIALLLWHIFKVQQAQARAVLLFWVLNPLVLYNAYFHGQFDLLPLFFVVLSLFLVQKGHAIGAAFCMGIGACYKDFPFLFLLPLVLVLAKSWPARLKLFLAGTLPYLLLFIPSLKNYQAWGATMSGRFFVGGYELGGGAQVYIFLAFYAALLWYLHRHQAHTLEDLWRACLAILLVYYQFSTFDLHYWAWIMPFAAIYWVERPREAKPFYLIIGLCLLVLLAPTPLVRFLAPTSPRFFLRLPSLLEALNPYLPMLFIVNGVRSLLAGTCCYLAWRLLRDMPASGSRALPAEAGPAVAAT